MNLKWLFWTGLLATAVFFSVIYFGMKYNWVGGSSKPSTSKSSGSAQKSLNPKLKINQRDRSKPKTPLSIADNPGNGVDPELIDEVDTISEDMLLGSSDLKIEDVVSQCQSLTESIGVPEGMLEQSINECIDRNSRHLATEDRFTDTERETMIREQCNVAITQKELLSDGEIKMLVDECVDSMTPKT